MMSLHEQFAVGDGFREFREVTRARSLPLEGRVAAKRPGGVAGKVLGSKGTSSTAAATPPRLTNSTSFRWFATPALMGRAIAYEFTPTPNPSPQGGGGPAGLSAMYQPSTVSHGTAASKSPSPLWGGVRGGGTKQRSSSPFAICDCPALKGEGRPAAPPRHSVGPGAST
ncbi:hypothetical protein C7I84_26550 [Mesorhizobium ephedrae]|uniref:Uncharacterized protein n=1 Tax=Kumtagia ephedrae TaxID=2116701 RepID=A0A2P7RR02_9HYPH|nr:hypothetical protein C7I84_26550 [Mesorhizobium ephedrae]